MTRVKSTRADYLLCLRRWPATGTGIVNNELFIGRMVWNRQRFVKDPSTGRRVARLNPASEWVVKEIPSLRIIDDELWEAVKERQGITSIKYANVAVAIQTARSTSQLNAFHRPRALLSGLVFRGVCGGSCSLKAKDRYICSAHVVNRSCDNSRSISRDDLESRALVGLKERLMAPEAAGEAMRAYAAETNRLNHERRADGEAYRNELAKIGRTLKQMLNTIEEGGYTRGMTDRMREMEAREDELSALLAQGPVDIPDIHPNVADVYRRKVERLAEALNNPEDRAEASTALRSLIEQIVLTPGPGPGEMHATLHGELSLI